MANSFGVVTIVILVLLSIRAFQGLRDYYVRVKRASTDRQEFLKELNWLNQLLVTPRELNTTNGSPEECARMLQEFKLMFGQSGVVENLG